MVWQKRYGIDGEETMTMNNDTAEEYLYSSDKDNIPEVYFFFDQRGEWHGYIGNSAIAVMKKDQFEYIMQFAGDLGEVQQMNHIAVIKGVNEEKAKQVFKAKEYVIVEATNDDFEELEREFDKLQTIKGGESETYK